MSQPAILKLCIGPHSKDKLVHGQRWHIPDGSAAGYDGRWSAQVWPWSNHRCLKNQVSQVAVDHSSWFQLQRMHRLVQREQWSKSSRIDTCSTICAGHRCTGDFCTLHMRSKLQHRRMHFDRFDGRTLLGRWNLHCPKMCRATESSRPHHQTVFRHSPESADSVPWYVRNRQDLGLQNQRQCWQLHGPAALQPVLPYTGATGECSRSCAPIWFLPCSCRSSLFSCPTHGLNFAECGELIDKSQGRSPLYRRIWNRCPAAANPLLELSIKRRSSWNTDAPDLLSFWMLLLHQFKVHGTGNSARIDGGVAAVSHVPQVF